ncbi:MAG TPA: acyltransferase [Kribbella sp.]|nr:acyltransferase [Kribbella sp.]
MARGIARPAGGSEPGGHGSAVEQWASRRRLYLDNLKVILIAGIIAGHALVGYSELALWSYAEVREVTFSGVTEIVLLVALAPFALLVIPLLFLVAGLLTPASLNRKGTGAFVRDRLLRLGVPFAVFVLLLQPLMVYALYHPLGAASGSYWHEFLGSEGQLDTGVLWFVGVLLIFSLAYAGWCRVRPHNGVGHRLGAITARHLVLLTIAVVATTFPVRLVYPFGSESGFTDLNLWEWPACLALFGLGITASGKGWLTAVPDRLRRQSRAAALVAVGAMGVFAASGDALGVVDDELAGGWHWAALVFATLECTVAVFGSVWLLGGAQRHLDRQLRWGAPLGRSAYGAFMLQGPVLIGLAVALRPISLPAEVKALIVAGGGIAGSFALAWLLITRLPVIARIT